MVLLIRRPSALVAAGVRKGLSSALSGRGTGLAVVLLATVLARPWIATAREASGEPLGDWPRGPSTDPAYFPIAVWLQDPANADAYREIGVNLFIGLWDGPRDDQLDALRDAGMPVMADQNATALQRLDERILVGWTQADEPDNAQPDGQGGYGPCVDPAEVVAHYERLRTADPSRPVFLNLGQNVAWDEDDPYIGRGSACSGRWDQYPEYVQGADIVSFDIYPVTSPYDQIRGKLWLVARGVDRLREWTGGRKPVWNVIETTHIQSDRMPTPHQIEAEVWMSLIHGSRGIVYFAHEWQPTFREAALLYYPATREAVSRINAGVRDLAPVINSGTDVEGARVTSTEAAVPIDAMVRQHDGATYVFAVAMRDAATTMDVQLPVAIDVTVDVLGESRTLPMRDGRFQDAFQGYDVHRYRVPTAPAARIFLPAADSR